MTLAESTVFNAIRHSMMKYCFANIIIAGPICAGKKNIAQSIAEFSALQDYVSHVTIIDQDNYYLEYEELEDTPFGVKNIDTKGAFNHKKFVNDVRTFYEKGSVSMAEYNRRKWTKNWWNITTDDENGKKTSHILETKYERMMNIIVGTHAIDLLMPLRLDALEDVNLKEHVVPKAIPKCICIYLDTDHDVCMSRRAQEGLMYPDTNDMQLLSRYSNFVKQQVEKEIATQKKKADIIINCREV